MMWTQEVSLLRAHSLGMEDAYLIKNVQNSDNCKHLHLICWVTKHILLKHFVFRYHFRLIDDSEGESYSIMSDSWWPYRLWPTRLLCPWNSPGKNTGAGSHSLLQGIFPTQGLNLCLLPASPSLATGFFTTWATWAYIQMLIQLILIQASHLKIFALWLCHSLWISLSSPLFYPSLPLPISCNHFGVCVVPLPLNICMYIH